MCPELRSVKKVEHKNDSPADRVKRNWRSTVIEPFKQLRMGIYVIGISVVFVLITSGLFILAFYQSYENVMEIFEVADMKSQFEVVVNQVFAKNAWRVAGAFVVYLAVLGWVVFKMTHKVYGPLVSIERFVSQIERGEYYRRARIRDKDDLQRLVRKLNNMADKLEKRHGKDVSKK